MALRLRYEIDTPRRLREHVHFVDGDPAWMTFIALGRADEIVLGVISVTARSERWWAARGEGAFRDGKPVTVSTTARLDDAEASLAARAEAEWIEAEARTLLVGLTGPDDRTDEGDER